MLNDVTKAQKPGNRPILYLFAATMILGALLTGAPAFAQSTPSDADFVAKVALGDLFEIEAGKLAEKKASPNASRLATPLAKDHTAMLADLKALVQGGKVKADIPAALDTSYLGKVDKLKGLKGGAFDKSYYEIQIGTQKENLGLLERYSKDGSNGELKSFATKYLPRLQKHLKDVTDTRAVLLDE